MMTYRVFVVVLCLVCGTASQGVGESCIKNGVPSVCRLLKDCQTDLAELKITRNYTALQQCSFVGHQPVTCCTDLNTTASPLAAVNTTSPLSPVTTTSPLAPVNTTSPLAPVNTTSPLAPVATNCPLAPVATTSPLAPVATTPRTGNSTTTEYVPNEYDYVTNEPLPQGCAPLGANETVAKIGRKAWDKCVEYHEQLVRPCERSVAILGGLARSNHCILDAQGPGMWTASRDTTPYAALLGYESPGGSVTWSCSGALLSNRFILSAAHCAFGRKRNLRAVAMVGSRKSSNNENRPQLHQIKRIIRHPQYRLSKHSDIALVQTETTITLDRWTVPACLDVFGGDRSSAVAATWISDTPDLVRKVTVQQEIKDYCMSMLGEGKRRRLDLSHVCYGEDLSPLDICDPDSWGPLTIRNPRISCMHSVIGISSIGIRCSMPKLRYITMVENYVPWIESIVWP